MANDNVHWSSQEMIENASSWSLAGDVAVLNSLKKFSENLLSDTESLNGKVDNLLNSLENVSLKLELTKNEFQSLRNTQFIENRVYEDDETFEIDESQPEEKEPTDEDKENAIKKAISKGLAIMAKYYDKVELAVSDSEDEGNEKSYVLQPKDQYADRPLPYLVGTQDWYKKWHVGLLPSDSESESEKKEDVYSSSSDSEEYLPKNRIVGSETSSELDFTNRNAGPVANSTFNDSQDRRTEDFHSSDESSEQSSSLPAKTPISNKKFAEQLAAKLGDVISGKIEAPESAAKPTGAVAQPAKYGNLFSDEPPPVDDFDDTLLPKSAHQGLFSGGKNLFTENSTNDPLWGLQQETSGSTKKGPDEQIPVLPSQSSSNISKAKVPKGLFDNSDSSSEEDLLTVTEKRRLMSATVANPYMQIYKTTSVPFVDEEPPEITPRNKSGASKKKPVTTNQEQRSEKVSVVPQAIKDKPLKKSGLFDESSDEDIFIPKTKKTGLKAPEKVPNVEGGKKLSLFEDSDDFTSPSHQASRAAEEVKKLSLFEDDDGLLHATQTLKKPNESKNSGLFDENPDISISSNQAQRESNISTKSKNLAKKISLFDDDDDDDFLKEEEDIFSNISKKKTLFDDFEERSLKRPTRGLFDDLEVAKSSNNTPKELSKSSESVETKSGVGNIETSGVETHTEGLFGDLRTPETSDNSDGNLFFQKQSSTETVRKQEIRKLDAEILSTNAEDSIARADTSEVEPDKISEEDKLAHEENKLAQSEDRNGSISYLTEKDASSNKVLENQGETSSGDTLHEDSRRSAIDKNYQQADIDPKVNQVSENVPKNIETVYTDEKEVLNVKDNNIDKPKPDKKEVLEKIRKNFGLFDSESEKSSDEDIFGGDDKKKEIETEQVPAENVDTLNNVSPARDEPSKLKDGFEEKVSDSGLQQNFVVPPPISLFDPTPPPVDWDATSDNSAESDSLSLTDGILDRTSYNQSQPTSSSLFDEAPPSLDVNDMNYSSGIVRDINVTRVETDDSSFYPHASSSRRFSSDIFGEQQSQDSFYVTKNRTDSLAQVSSLGKISEKSEEATSKIENLTPSGYAEDFEGSSSVFGKSGYDSDGDMDRTRSGARKPDVLQRIPIFDGGVEQKSESDAAKPLDRPAIKTSPGKLKHNLNINVGALLPGATPPRNRPAITKSASLDETDKSSVALARDPVLLPKPSIRFVKPKVFDQKEVSTEPTDQHFGNLSETEVLHSVTKDRARIPIKRRPSTRKARQESFRKSMTDLPSYQNVEPSSLSGALLPEADKSSDKSKSTFLDDLTEKLKEPDCNIVKETPEDLPEVKRISMVFDNYLEEKQEVIEKVHISRNKRDLFDSPTEDIFKSPSNIADVLDSDLFGTNLQHEEELKTERSLFEDLDEAKTKSAIMTKSSKVVQTKDETISTTPEQIILNNEDSYEDGGDIIKTTRTSTISSSGMRKDETKTERNLDLSESSITSQRDILKIDKPINEASGIFKTSPEVKKKRNIFGIEDSSSGSDEDLFSGASKLAKTKSMPAEQKLPKKTQKSGIFSDKSDSDSDIFGGKSKLSTSQAERRKTFEPPKKNIFNDSGDSSEDDLFGSKTSKSGSDVRGAIAGTRRVEVKTASVKKLENKEVTDFDPLSGFT